MKIPKKSYNIMKQLIHFEYDWRVKNDKGKYNGALQHKVWKPGERKVIETKVMEQQHEEAEDQLQCKAWDPRGTDTLLQKSDRPHRHESMKIFQLGSLMQDHPFSCQEYTS